MKKIYYFNKLIILFLIIILFLYHKDLSSQIIPESVVKKYNLNSNSTFFDIQNAMNEYWSSQGVNNGYVLKNGVESKVPGWKLYKRWEYYWEQRVNQKTGKFPNTTSEDEIKRFLKNPEISREGSDYAESWVNLGTNTSTGGYAGLGRINCIAFHPTDVNTYWVGSPSGGIWKTTNGGTNWTILNNNMSVLGVSAIVIPSDYATTNTIYIATGDRDGGSMWSLSGGQSADNASIGIYKSTDGGINWFATGFTYNTSDLKLVYSLVIHPSDNSILFASTSDGIYKTTNGGTSWTLKTANRWCDIEFKPGDPTIMYASSSGYTSTYINRSTNSGENWSFFSVATSGRRGEIAVTASNPSIVYLLSANSSGGVYGIYKSTDSGASFSVVNPGSPSGMLGYYTDGSGGSGGQGSYDLCIAVKPDNANIVYIGGITTWKSTNGGVNFTSNTCWTSHPSYNFSGIQEVHADKHALVYQNSSTLFEGNDGGIYKTTNDGGNWTDLSNGLIISQLYRIGVSQTSSNTIITGLQDNGSKLFNSGSWSDVTGGDGMECIVDYTTTTYMYATYVRGVIYRSADGGVSFPTTISANIPGGQPTGHWVTPYVIDQLSSSTLYAGFDKVWKTTNRGNSWASASQVLSSSAKLRSLAVAPSNSNYLYAADQTNMWRTTDGGTSSWTAITLPSITDYITYIAIKNTDPNTLWFTCGGFTSGNKVFESTDGGANWTNISTGLPNIPVMCIVQHKSATDRNVLFIGTDVGVYVKNGSDSWVSYNNGLPNVVVTELEIYYNASGNKLRAGTFGRGLWETDIESSLPVEMNLFTSSINKNNIRLNWQTGSEFNNLGFDIERSDNKNSEFKKIGFVTGFGNSNLSKNYSFEDKNLVKGKYKYRLRQIDFNGNYRYYTLGQELIIGIPDGFSISQNYPNPFNPKTKIDYRIAKDSKVIIKLYDITGKEVNTLVNEYKPADYYSLEFDGSNLASGIYFYRIIAGDYLKQLKMIIVK